MKDQAKSRNDILVLLNKPMSSIQIAKALNLDDVQRINYHLKNFILEGLVVRTDALQTRDSKDIYRYMLTTVYQDEYADQFEVTILNVDNVKKDQKDKIVGAMAKVKNYDEKYRKMCELARKERKSPKIYVSGSFLSNVV